MPDSGRALAAFAYGRETGNWFRPCSAFCAEARVPAKKKDQKGRPKRRGTTPSFHTCSLAFRDHQDTTVCEGSVERRGRVYAVEARNDSHVWPGRRRLCTNAVPRARRGLSTHPSFTLYPYLSRLPSGSAASHAAPMCDARGEVDVWPS